MSHCSPAALRLGVREAPGVEHERRRSRPRLDAQRVVVAVVAVAQRPAVEDQEPLAGALHEVAAVGEVLALARRRQQAGGQREQRSVVAGVAVRERRDLAVGTPDRVRELARGGEPRVE